MFCHQTQEVQKAMDEKKFEEAVRLRGRYFLTSYFDMIKYLKCLFKIHLPTNKVKRQMKHIKGLNRADRYLAALNHFITESARWRSLSRLFGSVPRFNCVCIDFFF